MFTAMGSFGVLAGLLLLVNLFVMLAAERKTELGMARAVGMRRSELVGAFRDRRLALRAVATVLGVAAGIGLGAVLVSLSARIFATEHNRFDLFFTLKPQSLAQSFAIAFVVALATIVGTSLRVSRLNIIRAIRDLAEPPPRRRRAAWARRRRAGRSRRRRAHAPGLVVARRIRAPARTDTRRSSGSRRSALASSALDQSTPSPRCSSSSGALRSSRSSPLRPRAPASCSTSSRESC